MSLALEQILVTAWWCHVMHSPLKVAFFRWGRWYVSHTGSSRGGSQCTSQQHPIVLQWRNFKPIILVDRDIRLQNEIGHIWYRAEYVMCLPSTIAYFYLIGISHPFCFCFSFALARKFVNWKSKLEWKYLASECYWGRSWHSIIKGVSSSIIAWYRVVFMFLYRLT